MGRATEESTTIRMREFSFSQEDFEVIRRVARDAAGISLADGKRELVYGRLSQRLRALNLASFAEYGALLEREPRGEVAKLCSALTTQSTSFFRDPHQFAMLREELVARCARARSTQRLRIWSAGCSTGEEPYSIAITVCEAIPEWRGWDVRILASDIDPDLLYTARLGEYSTDRTRGLSARRLDAFFRRNVRGASESFGVAPDVARLVTFQQANLLDEIPAAEPSDVVFCRNVAGHLDEPKQERLIARIAATQRPGDLLFTGTGETLKALASCYVSAGRATFRRK
jgi:chemotaxis protein methyltransferase CheR